VLVRAEPALLERVELGGSRLDAQVLRNHAPALPLAHPVLIDDAVSYMLSAADLRAVFATAYRHLEPGGVMVVAPDDTKETFRQNETYVSHAEGSTKPDDLEVVFVENNYDPDPDDETYEGTMVYLIREAGRLRIETDRHLHGLFPQAEWEAALAETGFEVHESGYTERRPGPDGTEREVTFATYACVRP